MQTICLQTWEEFESQAQQRREQALVDGTFGPMLFRGQRDAEWSLRTTLERRRERKDKFEDYYRIAYRVRPEIETLTGNRWDLPTFKDIIEVYSRLRCVESQAALGGCSCVQLPRSFAP